MTHSTAPCPLLQGLDKSDYDINEIDDEIRVDQLCVDLLRHLYQSLTRESRMSPEQAGECCHGADYFLREFVIAERQENIFNIDSIRIRQFAGHWYITRTLEPNMTDLKNILNGTAELYHYLARQGLVDQSRATEITTQCRETDYYQQRIEDYWAIEGDGYDAWRRACPL